MLFAEYHSCLASMRLSVNLISKIMGHVFFFFNNDNNIFWNIMFIVLTSNSSNKSYLTWSCN